jgi:pimeloyl-ACP methyl ester carboxylesterase
MATSATGNFVQLNDLSMYYQVHGQGEPLLLLHGGTATSDRWAAHIPKLSNHFQVITPDIRGHGKTKNPSDNLSYRLMADDMAALITQLGLEKPLVCGYSDGGQICLELGMHYPGLVKAYVVGAAYYEFSDGLINILRSFGINENGNIDVEGLEVNAPDFAAYLEQSHEMDWKDLMRQLAKMWATPLNYNADDFERIVEPTLLVVGDRDALVPLEQAVAMYRQIPNAEIAVAPNSGHEFVESNSELFTNIVLEFMMRQIS